MEDHPPSLSMRERGPARKSGFLADLAALLCKFLRAPAACRLGRGNSPLWLHGGKLHPGSPTEKQKTQMGASQQPTNSYQFFSFTVPCGGPTAPYSPSARRRSPPGGEDAQPGMLCGSLNVGGITCDLGVCPHQWREVSWGHPARRRVLPVSGQRERHIRVPPL
jgi:hypothetical protein